MGDIERSDVGAGFGGRSKLLIGVFLIVAAVIYLIVTSTQSAAQYYLTVEELLTKGESALDRDIKVSGAVEGDTIEYDAKSLELRFTIVNVPADLDEIERAGGLAQVLHRAVTDPSEPRVDVLYVGPMPDLLRHEAQAILTGRMGMDGVFVADELLLKCPTRYEEEIPLQVEEG
ncbi:MAG TPA: cytochrome c maturation protein CcmE [Anaerolineae bacterium]|nr:cytochrome c maturation protein CcmE [Anaerolineae bacterium]